jgi:hypothetical protein
VKNPCTGAVPAVLSKQTGRSYNGKSINREQALIVDEPKNAKPPNLSGVMLAPLRRSYSSCLEITTITYLPKAVKQKISAVVGMSYGPGRGTWRVTLLE